MKNLMLIMLLFLIAPGAFCQTVTFNDLLHFLNEKAETDYIHSHGYKEYGSQTALGHTLTFYALNNQSPKTESLIMGYGVTKKNGAFLHEVGYTTRDNPSANSLIKEIARSGFALTKRNRGKKWDTYRFEKNDLFVQVVISHQSALPNQVNLHYETF